VGSAGTLQSTKPFGQKRPQTPFSQVWLPGQTIPQLPQLLGSLPRLARQPAGPPPSTVPPSTGVPPQSVQPALHEPTAQTPATHAAVALGTTHWPPQAPQFMGSVPVLVSQPLASLPSQLLNPVLQLPSAQALLTQVPVALGYVVQGVQKVVLQPYAGLLTSTHTPSQIFCVAEQVGPESTPESPPPAAVAAEPPEPPVPAPPAPPLPPLSVEAPPLPVPPLM